MSSVSLLQAEQRLNAEAVDVNAEARYCSGARFSYQWLAANRFSSGHVANVHLYDGQTDGPYAISQSQGRMRVSAGIENDAKSAILRRQLEAIDQGALRIILIIDQRKRRKVGAPLRTTCFYRRRTINIRITRDQLVQVRSVKNQYFHHDVAFTSLSVASLIGFFFLK